jgi:hypothetical protein
MKKMSFWDKVTERRNEQIKQFESWLANSNFNSDKKTDNDKK